MAEGPAPGTDATTDERPGSAPATSLDKAPGAAHGGDGPGAERDPAERGAAVRDAQERQTAGPGAAERQGAERQGAERGSTGQQGAERPSSGQPGSAQPGSAQRDSEPVSGGGAGGEDAGGAHERARAEHGPRMTGPPKAQKGPGGGLLMGRPFGVPVYVAPSWFLVAALITWVFGGQLDRVLPELGGARYLVSLFFAVAFYASVLVHELAHTVAALRFKLPVRRIQLQFFGGVSEIEKESETPGREFVLAFVGPLLSLVLAGVFYAGMRAVEPGTVPGVLLAGLMISNLIVAVFNLLPGLPLDGGRMLRAVVWKITGKPMSGTIAAAWVGRALAVSVLIGLPLLNQSGALGGDPQEIGGMDTVTDALLAAILAAIIWTGAGNSLRMARLREHLPELRARTLTRRAVPVESGTPLSEALRRANDAGARALVVVDPDGDPTAVVREAAIVSVPQHRRPWVTVSGLAQDLTEGMRVSAELSGEELLDTLRATPATEYLVVEDSGEIYGVLSAADVERAFVKAMARPS
ncbi:site-2 protease family protein [Streptomyces flavofungini]|uniref:site-2 protease family protein n=1 Tax=Streptomyces flavofungini TaxID=68200 RepID=UPI003F80CD2F